jgi:hypothetical protein
MRPPSSDVDALEAPEHSEECLDFWIFEVDDGATALVLEGGPDDVPGVRNRPHGQLHVQRLRPFEVVSAQLVDVEQQGTDCDDRRDGSRVIAHFAAPPVETIYP